MNNRIGLLAASGLGVVGAVYLVAVALGVTQAGLTEPIRDPVLAVMEVITLLAGPLLIVLMVAVHGHAPADRKPLALIALCFATLAGGTTMGVHFVALSAGRQLGFTTLDWPSTLYALELLAWDVFLGLSLLFTAPIFVGAGVDALARWSLAVTGALCLLGAAGPLAGDMAIQRIGILGYGLFLPAACTAVALVFRGRAGR